MALSFAQLTALQSLGECLNYNGYGESLADLYFEPAELYRQMRSCSDPFKFMAESSIYPVLKEGYEHDMTLARDIAATQDCTAARIFVLPAEKWARRISGVFGNRLAVDSPVQAHAVLTARTAGGYVVSVRAPIATPSGADEVCSQFASGGGRRGAAGINHLPETELVRFVARFFSTFTRS